MWNLKNKTVVISGATNGIGKAAAIELSKENPKLLFTYRNQDLADELHAEIKALSPDTLVHSVYCDFSTQDSIKKCADEVKWFMREYRCANQQCRCCKYFISRN